MTPTKSYQQISSGNLRHTMKPQEKGPALSTTFIIKTIKIQGKFIQLAKIRRYVKKNVMLKQGMQPYSAMITKMRPVTTETRASLSGVQVPGEVANIAPTTITIACRGTLKSQIR